MEKLIAKEAFYYNQKSLTAGEEFDPVSDEDARVLKLIGRAQDIEAPQQKRTYRRRDMTAEQ